MSQSTTIKVIYEHTDDDGTVTFTTYRLVSGSINLGPRTIRVRKGPYDEVYDTGQVTIELEGDFEKVPVMYIPPDDHFLEEARRIFEEETKQ